MVFPASEELQWERIMVTFRQIFITRICIPTRQAADSRGPVDKIREERQASSLKVGPCIQDQRTPARGQ
jgi:hypothetical protein